MRGTKDIDATLDEAAMVLWQRRSIQKRQRRVGAPLTTSRCFVLASMSVIEKKKYKLKMKEVR